MSVAVLVPVLGRPHRVRPLIDSLERTARTASVVFLSDPGDDAEHGAIASARITTSLRIDHVACGGNYAQKVNRGVRITSEPLLFLGADDLHFHPGWLEAASGRLTDTVGVVGTNDLCNRRVIRGEHSTHSLVARWYAELGTIDEPGKLLHEGYPHEFVDDEFIATAKHRDAYAHADDSIVEHLHPMVGKAPMDHLYEAQAARMRRGRKLFTRRQPLWT